MAQLGSALDWGSSGRRFKSCQPDQRSSTSEAVSEKSGAAFFVPARGMYSNGYSNRVKIRLQSAGMGKNANGEGSIYKRTKDGRVVRYEGALSYIDDDGRTKRHTVYGRTRADVRDKLKQARERLDAGGPVKDDTRTVAQWLAQWRATTLEASDRARSTKQLYSDLSRRHLEPEPFGATRLDKLKPSDVEGLILSLRNQTKPGKPTDDGADPKPVRALSDSTIRSTYAVLRQALDTAVRDGLLAKNPAAAVKRPGVERHEAQHLSVADVTAILKAAEGLRYRPVLVLIAATGMRRGAPQSARYDGSRRSRTHHQRAQDRPQSSHNSAAARCHRDVEGTPNSATRGADARRERVGKPQPRFLHRDGATCRGAKHLAHHRDRLCESGRQRCRRAHVAAQRGHRVARRRRAHQSRRRSPRPLQHRDHRRSVRTQHRRHRSRGGRGIC